MCTEIEMHVLLHWDWNNSRDLVFKFLTELCDIVRKCSNATAAAAELWLMDMQAVWVVQDRSSRVFVSSYKWCRRINHWHGRHQRSLWGTLYNISVVTDSESATASADFSRVSPNQRIFAAVSDGFGSSVRESVFTYQVAVHNSGCRPPSSSYWRPSSSGRVIVGSGTVIIGLVSSGRRWGMLRNNPNRR